MRPTALRSPELERIIEARRIRLKNGFIRLEKMKFSPKQGNYPLGKRPRTGNCYYNLDEIACLPRHPVSILAIPLYIAANRIGLRDTDGLTARCFFKRPFQIVHRDR